MVYRKRKYRASLKSLVSRKRRRRMGYKRRGRKTIAFSSRTLNPTTYLKKRGTKLSKRKFRNLLWTQTITQTKYKSCGQSTRNFFPPLGILTKLISTIDALSNVAGSEFFRVGGGLQPINAGVPPNLGIDLSQCIIRGGLLNIQASLSALAADSVMVTVELRFLKQQSRSEDDANPSNTGDSYLNVLTGTARPLLWTVDDHPDNSTYLSKAVLSKSMELKAGDSFNVAHRIRPVKVDVGQFAVGAGYHPIWIIYSNQITATAVDLQETVTVTVSHDLSFCASADAI